jgi:hypothetical protein
MKYEAPELTELTHAVSAIQINKDGGTVDAPDLDDVACYEDWED